MLILRRAFVRLLEYPETPTGAIEMISREEAAKLAVNELRARGLGTEVRVVLELRELSWRAPLLYLVPPDLADCWIAYAAKPRPVIAASTIVVIDKTSGRVVYSGSANDEG
jgi:hypothetical protein